MAAKDVDLATDYAQRSLLLVEDLSAQLVLTDALINTNGPDEDTFLVAVGPSSGGVTYRMRGYDGDLSRYVYWASSSVDSAGVDYGGNSGALTDVVVQNVIGVV